MFGRARKHQIMFVFFIFQLFSDFTMASRIIYVDKDANDINTGSNWSRAERCFQDALNEAQSGDEIRVAQGIYKPDETFVYGRKPKIVSSGDRAATFQLKNGVTIKGGYAGFGEPNPDIRDIALYETILSGDLDSNDVEVDDPCDLLNEPTRSENSYHVIRGDKTNETAVLDGFTITAGNANGSLSDRYGGGMLIENSSIIPGVATESSNPTLKNCTFACNSSSYWGGGVYNGSNCNPEFINCTFEGNFTAFFGGGSFNFSNSNPEFISCTFIGNKAKNGGGAFGTTNNIKFTNCSFNSNFASGDATSGNGAGLYMSGDDISLTNCTFYSNKATRGGGGIYNGCLNMMLNNCKFVSNTAKNGAGICNDRSGSFLTCCTFSANTALEYGGAISNYASDLNLTNCIFFGNYGVYGNALYCSSTLGVVKINNCILWDGGNEIYDYHYSNITVIYSDVKGGEESPGNIDADPLFANPGYCDSNNTPDDPNDDFWVEGDYHLKSQAGRFDPNIQSWILDDVTSPCIDTGDPLTPIGYEPQPNGSRINMGAYGGTEQASMSLYDVSYFPKSYDPNPPDNALDVNLESVLTWISDVNAIAYEVYFGTNWFPPFVQKYYENKLDPGVLLPNTQYYWRVDNIDSMINRIVGDIWTFSTGPEPFTAYNPSPEDGSDNVLPDTLLSWNPGSNAFLHNLYLDTDFNKVNSDYMGVMYFAKQDSNYYNPDMLEFGQAYYWRIDEEDIYHEVTRGNVWMFKTSSIPFKAYNPSPEYGAINAKVGQEYLEEAETLSWFPGLNAVTHDVYLGTDYNDVNNASITNPLDVLVSIGEEPNFYQPDEFEYNQLYYWRIDETDSNGVTTKGDIWIFTTETHPPKTRCFTGQTPVWIDGKTVSISKAVINQKTSLNGKIKQIQVHEGIYTLYDILLESGNYITVADNHYFLAESDKWLSLHEFKAGMKLKTSKDSIEIKSIKKNPLPFTGKVYNLKIEGSDLYMVGEDAVIVSDY